MGKLSKAALSALLIALPLFPSFAGGEEGKKVIELIYDKPNIVISGELICMACDTAGATEEILKDHAMNGHPQMSLKLDNGELFRLIMNTGAFDGLDTVELHHMEVTVKGHLSTDYELIYPLEITHK